MLAWCGPIFLAIFTGFWGVLAGNMPPAGADLTPLEIAAHYVDKRMALIVACRSAWSVRRFTSPGAFRLPR